MTPEQEIRVQRLQDNLMAIRKFAGWSTQDLGALIGVTKQTIGNIENGNTKMSLTQYIAIRAILDDEMRRQEDNETLRMAVAILLDDDKLSEEEQEELRKKTEFIATAMSEKSQKDMGMKMALETLGSVAAGVTVGVITKNPAAASSTWLATMRTLSGKRNNDHIIGSIKKNRKGE